MWECGRCVYVSVFMVLWNFSLGRATLLSSFLLSLSVVPRAPAARPRQLRQHGASGEGKGGWFTEGGGYNELKCIWTLTLNGIGNEVVPGTKSRTLF